MATKPPTSSWFPFKNFLETSDPVCSAGWTPGRRQLQHLRLQRRSTVRTVVNVELTNCGQQFSARKGGQRKGMGSFNSYGPHMVYYLLNMGTTLCIPILTYLNVCCSFKLMYLFVYLFRCTYLHQYLWLCTCVYCVHINIDGVNVCMYTRVFV